MAKRYTAICGTWPGARAGRGRANTARDDSCSWDVDYAGCTWVVTLHSPREQAFNGKTLEEALAWCGSWRKGPQVTGDWGPGTRRVLTEAMSAAISRAVWRYQNGRLDPCRLHRQLAGLGRSVSVTSTLAGQPTLVA